MSVWAELVGVARVCPGFSGVPVIAPFPPYFRHIVIPLFTLLISWHACLA